MEEDMDEGQTQKGKKAFICVLHVTWAFCQCDSGASAETDARMLALSLLFFFWIAEQLFVVIPLSVIECQRSAEERASARAVGGVWTAFQRGLDCLCLLDKAFMLVTVAKRETWRGKKTNRASNTR